ncbi:MAG TPA: NAD(P)-dependent oxidoreductase, partial [Acidimicrobiia bacterium]|nr:NAD(P)-dependent oxidoreductase [Acidimicrobiia bacterium]
MSPADPPRLAGRRVLVTGATGRVAFPIARALAAENTVYGAARFSDPAARERLEAAGVIPVPADLGTHDMATLPDADYVFHAGAALGRDVAWRTSFEVNAAASGRLVARYRGVEGFVFCSTGSVYAYQGARPLCEDDPPGLHLGVYSLSKIAAESVVAFAAEQHAVPTTIIRIFSTYGPMGGAPADRLDRLVAGRDLRLHPEAPNRYNPIYEDDYVRLGVRALLVGRVPPVVVNWAGSETVSAEEYCEYLGELVGITPRFVYS